MSMDNCFKKIDGYLAGSASYPLVVDVQNFADRREIVTRYNVGNNEILRASEFCKNDGLPRLDEILAKITSSDRPIFVTELSTFLKLQGEQALSDELRAILSEPIDGHVILITYQCEKYLTFKDIRLNSRVYIHKGDKDDIPEIVFTSQEFVDKRNEVYTGIKNIPDALMRTNSKKIFVLTDKTKNSFPESLMNIRDFRSAFEAVKNKDNRNISESLGTNEQWLYALKKFRSRRSWEDVIDAEFMDHNNLEFAAHLYMGFDPLKKWLFFIGLKIFGTKKNRYLEMAVSQAESVDDLVTKIYRCILDIDHKDKRFKEYYEARKQFIVQLGDTEYEAENYCKVALSKGRDTIYYLTDNTEREKEAVFEIIDRYGSSYERDELVDALKTVYPDLYQYLQPYRYNNELFDKYFYDYNYQKVTNKIDPEFEKIVIDQSEKREYNRWLEPRASVIESIDATGAKVYFVDAMGVEFLSYIKHICEELKLFADVHICRCELPSITSENKEFVEYFEQKSIPVISVKGIDDLKHKGKDDHDYQHTKLPIHLIGEMEIIKDLVNKIRAEILRGDFSKIILISDHGASRLAVIKESETLWEMAEKGKHSGRCCLKADTDIQPDFAADAGEYWALANYDRFKGGRKADVEVHGGATLEEIAVPIIEITKSDHYVEIFIMPVEERFTALHVIPEIKVSFRKKARIKIYSTEKLENVEIAIDNKLYTAHPMQGEDNYYIVDMPDIKKAKTYMLDVYSKGNIIAEKLKLIVKKEGVSEQDIL